MTNEEVILKTDALGRVRVPRAKREEMLDVFESGELSAAAFARAHGVPVQTFANWIQQRRRARGDYENESVRRKLRMRKRPAPELEEAKESSSHAEAKALIQPMSLIEVATLPMEQEQSALEITLSGGVAVKVTTEAQIPLLKSLITELAC